MAFGRALRRGIEPAVRPAAGAQVEKALRGICLAMDRQGFRDPRKHHSSQERLDKKFSDWLKQAKREDPAPKRQAALPSSIVRLAVRECRATQSEKGRATADLITLAFFFLLRVGEYTETTEERLTVPLRRGDITLWRGNHRLTPNATDEELYQATGVTIRLANQKNGIKDAVLHHDSSGDPEFDPVRAAAHIHSRLRSHPESRGIGTYVIPGGHVRGISATDIRVALRGATLAAALLGDSVNPALVGSHSLRSGGAMHLKLAGYDELTIKKLGRWSSDTYLIYIQSQIANLNAGIAQRMAQRLSFRSVA